jgi:hypothetical protein
VRPGDLYPAPWNDVETAADPTVEVIGGHHRALALPPGTSVVRVVGAPWSGEVRPAAPRACEPTPCVLCEIGAPKRSFIPHRHSVFYEDGVGYVHCRGPGCALCAAILLSLHGPYGTRRRSPLTALWLVMDDLRLTALDRAVRAMRDLGRGKAGAR